MTQQPLPELTQGALVRVVVRTTGTSTARWKHVVSSPNTLRSESQRPAGIILSTGQTG